MCREKHSARPHTIRARYAHPTARPIRTRYVPDTRTPAHDTRTIRARWRTVARDVAGLSTTVLEECLWWCCSISVQELTRSDAVYVSASYPIRTKFPTKSLSCHQSEQ